MLLKKHKAKIKNIEEKIPDFTNTTTTATAVNAKLNEARNKMPIITNLATTTALTAVENKYLIFVILSKKLTITQKLVKLEIKLLLIMMMINILLLKNLLSYHYKFLLQEAQAQGNSASKNDIADFVKKTDFENQLKNLNKNLSSNKNELDELLEKVKSKSR